ncbi:MAG: thiamine-phosphate pyrophosphorylase [Nitrospirae bacterium]|nr:MAG: thiamine-phosphate pyrophosphorylase [Nitrospirota bacterium]
MYGVQSLIGFKLYLITDRNLFADDYSLLTAVEQALKAGVKAIQLREKDLEIRELLAMAYKMREVTKKYKAKFFINDRVDIALAVKADGVHLGQGSMPLSAVRKIAGNKLIIGASTHNIDEAKKAEKGGADFITLGPVYKTASKLKYGKPIGIDTLKKVKSRVSIPVFAIGGIKTDMVKEVMGAGADGIALISGILGAVDIKSAAKNYIMRVNGDI